MKHSNPPAEMMLLAILYNDPTQYSVIDTYMSEDDFTLNEHRLLWQIFVHLSKVHTGRLTKEHILAAVKELDIDDEDFNELTDDGRYVDKIIYYDASNEEIIDWLFRIKQETYKRRGIDGMKRLCSYLDVTKDEFSDIIQRVEDTILQVGEESHRSKRQSKQIFHDAKDVIFNLADDPVIGADVDLTHWQRAVGSLRNRTVHLVVANTGSGKSQFALRAAMKVARKMPVLYCDSEMDEEMAIVRGFCIIHGIPYDYIAYGLWQKSEGALAEMGYDLRKIANIMQCAAKLNDMANWARFDEIYGKNFHYLNINGMSVTKSLPQVRRWVINALRDRDIGGRESECLIVIDQIKLNDAIELKDAKLQEFQFLGLEMSNLHDFAHKMNVPILVMGQTNAMGDVQGAKRLKDTASSVTKMVTKNRDALKNDMNGNVILIVDKSRHGGLPEHAYINLLFDRANGSIKELGIGGINEDKDSHQHKRSEQVSKEKFDDGPAKDEDKAPDNDEWSGG